MALLARFSRLLKADLHGVLDNLEEPELLLRQALRDMESAQQQQQAVCEHLEHQIQRLDSQAGTLQRELETLCEQLDRCFVDGDDRLIRTVIKRRLIAEQQLTQVQANREGLLGNLQQEQKRLQQQSQRLDALKQQARLAVSSQGEPPVEETFTPGVITEADVDLAILRERQMRGAS